MRKKFTIGFSLLALIFGITTVSTAWAEEENPNCELPSYFEQPGVPPADYFITISGTLHGCYE